MTSAIDATKPITGSPTTQSVRDNFAAAKSEILALQTSLAGLVGMGKNALINPNFSINQQSVSGTVSLAAGVYGHDGWKAGASGCTYTFATTNGITTLTITAGSLQQIIESVNVPIGSNTCCLSWVGTSQGKIASGSYAASGVTATVTGGSNLTVEFNSGTLSLVQLEKSTTPTLFEQRPYPVELALCFRYYEYVTAVAFQAIGNAVMSSTTSALGYIKYTPKRAAPTIGISAGWNIYDGTTNLVVSALAAYNAGIDSAGLTLTLTGAGTANRSGVIRADATAGRVLIINAQL